MVWMGTSKAVQIVEVGPRDGLQMIDTFVPTARKIELLRLLHRAGVRRAEIGSFASAQAIPQFADIRDVVAAVDQLPDFDGQVLVATARRALEAVDAGCRHLVFVVSVSEKHNVRNVRRTPHESILEYARLVEGLGSGVSLRVNVATAFDCPFDGPVDGEAALDIVKRLADVRADVEIALCDTTGRVTPNQVDDLYRRCISAVPVSTWAFHGHDTYGMGIANVVAAWRAGVNVVDASFGGLGGCPFAPGATGNVATEDVVWLFERMGVRTGIDLDALLVVASEAAALRGACAGGRVRDALAAARRRETAR